MSKWEELTNREQEDLREWYNQRDLVGHERRLLADLFIQGKFHAWNCPTCGERCYWGDPDDWGDFQGVRQLDFTSYPGQPEHYTDWITSRQCDDCRMRLVTHHDLEVVGDGSAGCWVGDE